MKRTGVFLSLFVVLTLALITTLPTAAKVAPAGDMQIMALSADGVVMAARTCGIKHGVCKPGGKFCRCEP